MADRFNTATTEKKKDEWLTPPHILRALGHFDLDPCAPRREVRPWDMAEKHFTGERGLFDQPDDPEHHDGLRTAWEGRVWLNPPYGDETFIWMEKLARHGSGIGLIFARTETFGFHRAIWDKATAVFFFEGRISFYHVTGEQGDTANAPSCLVAYSEADGNIIAQSGLKGRLVWLR